MTAQDNYEIDKKKSSPFLYINVYNTDRISYRHFRRSQRA